MKDIFLLGAGFTFDISEGQFPLTNKDISERIIPCIDGEIAKKYGFGKDYFEVALTRLDIDYESNPNIASPEERIDFELLKFKKNLREAREAIHNKLNEIFSMQGKQKKTTIQPKFSLTKFLKRMT